MTSSGHSRMQPHEVFQKVSLVPRRLWAGLPCCPSQCVAPVLSPRLQDDGAGQDLACWGPGPRPGGGRATHSQQGQGSRGPVPSAAL